MAKVVDKKLFFEHIGYVPHSRGQWNYHLSTARFKIACCGRRWGKSTAAGKDLEPALFVPQQRFWIVGPTYDLAEKEFRVIWDDLIIGMGLGKDKRVKKAYNKRSGEMYIEFPWQTRLEVRSADHPENLVGESLNGVVLSEAAKHKRETWERYMRPALADHRGWASFPTTPEGFNWLHTLWQLGQNDDHKDYISWRFPSWENPHVYPEGRQDSEILLLEKTTAIEWFQQEIAADFASFVGKIYDEFDETVHVKNVEYDPALPNYIAFDWGYVNPLAAVEFQIDPFDNIRVWREHYKAYTRLEDHLLEMAAREQPPGYKIDCTFGDAADPEATMTVNMKFAPCISEPAAKTNWRQGINLVKGFLKPRPVGVADEYGTPLEEPGLVISPNCPNLIKEFNNYRAPDRVVSSIRESGAGSAAYKQDDHALDALRYGLVHIYELGVQRHLEEVYSLTELNSSAPSGGYFTTKSNF